MVNDNISGHSPSNESEIIIITFSKSCFAVYSVEAAKCSFFQSNKSILVQCLYDKLIIIFSPIVCSIVT